MPSHNTGRAISIAGHNNTATAINFPYVERNLNGILAAPRNFHESTVLFAATGAYAHRRLHSRHANIIIVASPRRHHHQHQRQHVGRVLFRSHRSIRISRVSSRTATTHARTHLPSTTLHRISARAQLHSRTLFSLTRVNTPTVYFVYTTRRGVFRLSAPPAQRRCVLRPHLNRNQSIVADNIQR